MRIVFSISDWSLPLCEKNGTQKKNSYIRAKGSSYDSAGQWLFMQRCHAKVWVWKIANFQDHDCTAQLRYVHASVHTLFIFVISSSNKHILYESVVSVWWCLDMICDFKSRPLARGDTCLIGTHIAGPSGALASQVSLYYHHAKFNIYHVYCVQDNCNVFDKYKHFTGQPA